MSEFKKYMTWAVLGLFIYMPFHIFISQWLSTFTGGLEVWKIAKDVLTALLAGGLVLWVLATRKYTRLYLGFVAFAIVYAVLHLILWLVTDQPQDTGALATIYNNRLVWYLLIGYSAVLLRPDWVTPRRFAKVLLAVSVVVCLVGFAQWLLPKDIMTHFGYSVERGVKPNFFIDDKPDFPRVFSTIRDPNSLGAFLILPSVLSLLAMVKYWKTDRRMLFAGIWVLCGLVTILTFSRGAWISIVAAQLAALLFVFRQQVVVLLKKYVIVWVLGLVLVFCGVFALRDHYIVQNVVFHADESTTLDDPNELRVKLYQKSLDGIEDEPLGNGPGTAGLVSTRLPGGGLLTENYYLQIAYEVGVLGVMMFVGFVAVIALYLWRLRQSLIVQALFASLVGLSIMGLLIHVWSNEAIAASWFILAGIVLGGAAKRKPPIKPAKRAKSTRVRG